MKRFYIFIVAGLLAITLAGCSRQSEPEKPQAKSAAANLCAHGASKEICFICDPKLRDKSRLWCEEHARYEDRCWKCHPDLRDPKRLYCEEHGIYEDECFICHPEIQPPAANTNKVAHAPAPEKQLMCREHGVAEAECSICHPELIGQLTNGAMVRVKLANPGAARQAGIQTVAAEKSTAAESVELLAEVSYNLNKLAQITPLVSGVVTGVEVDWGARVEAGTVLARVSSVAISEAQSEFQRAVTDLRFREQTVTRERNLRAQNITAQRDLQEAEAAWHSAEAAVHEARQHLATLGYAPQQIETLATNLAAPAVLEVRAPFAGEIVERMAVAGGVVEPGKPLFVLADPSTMWAMLQVPEQYLSRLKVGQEVELRLDSDPGSPMRGKLAWISSSVDERTRMGRARAELSNPGGRLKARTFARARVFTGEPRDVVTIPAQAMQRVQGQPLVFVQESEDLFAARVVQVTGAGPGSIEVAAGLKAGEKVVSAGSFTMKSQLLLSRLGAGCVDE